MPDVPKIDIRPDHWEMVRDILQKHVPQHEVWAFGSRAKWAAKEFSDLDLAVIGNKPLSLDVSAALSDEFSESDLPYRVDVVDWATTSESFRKIIERDKVVVQKVGRGWVMGSDWPLVRVEDVCSLIVDCVNKTAPVSEQPTPYRMIRTTNVRNGRINLSDCKFVDEETYGKWTRRAEVRAGDVILTREAPIGEVGAVPDTEGLFLGQRLMQYRANPSKLDQRFLLYSFLSPQLQHQFGSHEGSGSVVSHIRVGDCFKFELRLPPLPVQQKIGEILGALDDKIDLNRRINQTLEAMAQAIFKSWFVDFDPVKAKIAAKAEGQDLQRAAMRAISGKTDAELDALPTEQYEQLATTAALFPDEMVDSELGEIPKGWVFQSVADIAQFAKGKVEVSSLTEETYISTENMLEARAGITCATSLPSVATVPSFKAGQILVSNIRPYFKKIWLARFDGGRSPDVLAFESANPNWAEFLYNLMYQDTFFEFMTRTAKGAKMPRGDKDAIMGWRFPCPDELLMAAFSEKVRLHYAHIENQNSQSKSLADLRDTLLPKLLSGELAVSSLDACRDASP